MAFDRADNVVICVEAEFEAAHHLPAMPEGHKCKRMHGHNYKIEVRVRGVICVDSGVVTDYADIETVLAHEVINQWDHRILNECGFEHPTSENLCVEIYRRIAKHFPVDSVRVCETPRYWAEYRGNRSDVW